MYIANVKVSNVLRFHDDVDVDLSFARPDGKFEGWTVLAGRNGSGKTSLLRCIALAITGPEVAARIAPSFVAWSREGGEKSGITMDLHLDRYELKEFMKNLKFH